MTTKEMIESLNGTHARQILEAIVHHRMAPDTTPNTIPAMTPELRDELASVHDLGGAPIPSVSEGELARQALLVLAEDPATRAAIESMATQPAATLQKYDFGATVAIATAVLLVLQTHYKFERRPDGRWTITLEKKPTSDALLKNLVQKLLGFSK